MAQGCTMTSRIAHTVTLSNGQSTSRCISLSCSQFSGLRRVEVGSLSETPLANLQQKLSSSGKGHRGVVTMAGTGKFFVGGNWKCNGTQESIATLVTELNNAKLEDDVDVIVAPPAVYIDQVVKNLNPRIEVSAQNAWVGEGGAFTGEVSADQLTDVGCKWLITGHSERRHVIEDNGENIPAASLVAPNEGDTEAIVRIEGIECGVPGDVVSLSEKSDFIGKKSSYALSKDLKVIGCVGETLEERESGHTFDVLFEQMQAFVDELPSWEDVVIAYEPVWAIGTGKVATPQQAQEVHTRLRKWLSEVVSSEVASQTRIIYGGSVTGANSGELAKQEDIDGFLVGGASLKGLEFATIINSVTSKKVAA